MSLLVALGKFEGRPPESLGLTDCSAKELEHFERVRDSFESSDSKKPATAPPASQAPRNSQPSLPNAFTETAPSRPKAPSRITSKGKSKGKGGAKSPVHLDSDDGHRGELGDEEDEDDDDDYVIKTDHLKVNGNGTSQVLSNGSVTVGKGKGASQGHFQDTAAEDDEEMYS